MMRVIHEQRKVTEFTEQIAKYIRHCVFQSTEQWCSTRSTVAGALLLTRDLYRIATINKRVE